MRGYGHRVAPPITFVTLQIKGMIGGAFTENGADILNGTPADQSDGSILLPLKGGKAVGSATIPDPDDAACVWGAWPLLDPNGEIIAGDVAFAAMAQLDYPSGAVPTKADDVAYFFAVCNSTTPVSATVDGALATHQMLATLTQQRIRGHNWINGVVGAESNGAQTMAGVVGMNPVFLRGRGTAASTTIIWNPATVAFDSAKERLAAGVDQASGATNTGVGQLYALFGAYRLNAANAGLLAHHPRIRYGVTPLFRAGV